MEKDKELRERIQAAVNRGLQAWYSFPDEAPQILRVNHLVGSLYHLKLSFPPPLQTIEIDALYLDGPDKHANPLFIDATGFALVVRRSFDRGRDI